MHVDPVRTHVISAIINIDQQLDENVSLRISFKFEVGINCHNSK